MLMSLVTFLLLLMLIICMPSLFHLRKHSTPDSNTFLNLFVLGRAGLDSQLSAWIHSQVMSNESMTKAYVAGAVTTWVISNSERGGTDDIVKSVAEAPPGKLLTAVREEVFKLEQTHKRVTGRTGEWWILSNKGRLEKFSLFSLAKWRLRGDMTVYASFQAS